MFVGSMIRSREDFLFSKADSNLNSTMSASSSFYVTSVADFLRRDDSICSASANTTEACSGRSLNDVYLCSSSSDGF